MIKDYVNNSIMDKNSTIYDLETENFVISSLLNHYQTISDTQDVLTADCFNDLSNREIFMAIMELYKRGENTSHIQVGDELQRRGSKISKTDLLDIIMKPNTYQLREDALRLKEYALRRKLQEVGYNCFKQSGDLSFDIETTFNDFKKRIESVFQEEMTDSTISLAEVWKELDERMLTNQTRENEELIGTPSGFPMIDSKGGLCPSDLIVVGATTSQGKSSFATAMAVNAITNGHPVAFYSMEMTPLQLASRIAAMKSGTKSSDILNEKLSMEQILHIDSKGEELNKNLLHFDGRSVSSLDHILTSIRMMKIKHRIKGAVVDYLQLVKVMDKTLNTEQSAAKIARDLKNLAKELDIWIIVISQLNRNANGNPTPTLSRLRDSGQIEEAADMIILIYRPDEGKSYSTEGFEDVPTKNTAMIHIAKGRNVGTGKFICGFNPEITLFYPLKDYELNDLRDSNKREEPF